MRHHTPGPWVNNNSSFQHLPEIEKDLTTIYEFKSTKKEKTTAKTKKI
jgi:hypothetical protein